MHAEHRSVSIRAHVATLAEFVRSPPLECIDEGGAIFLHESRWCGKTDRVPQSGDGHADKEPAPQIALSLDGEVHLCLLRVHGDRHVVRVELIE